MTNVFDKRNDDEFLIEVENMYINKQYNQAVLFYLLR